MLDATQKALEGLTRGLEIEVKNAAVDPPAEGGPRRRRRRRAPSWTCSRARTGGRRSVRAARRWSRRDARWRRGWTRAIGGCRFRTPRCWNARRRPVPPRACSSASGRSDRRRWCRSASGAAGRFDLPGARDAARGAGPAEGDRRAGPDVRRPARRYRSRAAPASRRRCRGWSARRRRGARRIRRRRGSRSRRRWRRSCGSGCCIRRRSRRPRTRFRCCSACCALLLGVGRVASCRRGGAAQQPQMEQPATGGRASRSSVRRG